MRTTEWINASFFSLFVALAWLRRMPPRGRTKATLIGSVGIGLTLAATYARQALPLPVALVIRDWLPLPLMLLLYWQAGTFVDRPSDRLQKKLHDFDDRFLRVMPLMSLNSNALLHTYLEFAYLLCYPMIPLGLGLLYSHHHADRADQYWSVILSATYLCHVPQAFVHALPPRLLTGEFRGFSDRNPVRRLNLWILRRVGIQVITFPSAHVAMTMAASLVLLQLFPFAGILFSVLSVSIAVATVAGRYHYVPDVLLGATIAVAAYLGVTRYLS